MSRNSEKVNTQISHLPHIQLSQRQLSDVELILNGGFAPLKGFLNEDEYDEVVRTAHLPSGEVWPMPIVLDVPEDHGLSTGDDIVLIDAYGTVVAVLHIESIYMPDKAVEVQHVYGTNDTSHWGVEYILHKTHPVYVGGTVQKIALPTHELFQNMHKTPREVIEMKDRLGIQNLVGFQTRNPLHRAHFEVMRRAAEDHGAHVLIHPAVGETKTGDIDAITRVRAYSHVHEKYAKDFTLLSLLPLAMRMAGPREALWHALIRKNYGCTHFIVGRDHAGPGKDANGKPFYGLYDAQEYAQSFEDAIGMKIIAAPEMFYDETTKEYMSAHEQTDTTKPLALSGTEFRAMLREKKDIPEWFSFPEVLHELQTAQSYQAHKGFVIFFTGLSGAGKSTIAQALQTRLIEIQHKPITYLDGDIVRQHVSKGLGFSKEDRNTNIKRIGFIAAEVAKHGGIALCAAIAPYESSREYNRARISEYGTYIEVYVATPLSVCRERDVKGLYAKAEAGLVTHVTGIDDPYEVPETAEIIIDTSQESLQESVNRIIQYVQGRELLQ